MLNANSQCEFDTSLKQKLRYRSETCSSVDSLLSSDGSTVMSNLDMEINRESSSDSDVANWRNSTEQLEKEQAPQLDEAKKNKIISLAEFYFSDEQLLKDVFLLKHVKRNKEGYVSLKLLSSFKKMKSATKDWNEVALALRESDQFELNESGTKVRRKEPLPNYDETSPSRVILAFNLPFEKPTVADLMPLFSKAGDIVSIRIVNPGSISAEVKKYKIKNQALGSTVCAVVEYDTYITAAKSADILCSGDVDSNWRKMRVIHVATSVPEPTPPVKTPLKESSQKRKRTKQKSRMSGGDTSDSLADYSTSPSLSNSDIDQPSVQSKRQEKSKKKPSERRRSSASHVKSNSYSENRSNSASGGSVNVVGRFSPKLASKYSGERRYSEGNVLGETLLKDRRRACSFCVPAKSAVQVLRNPIGPDGTSGFRNLRTLWTQIREIPVC